MEYIKKSYLFKANKYNKEMLDCGPCDDDYGWSHGAYKSFDGFVFATEKECRMHEDDERAIRSWYKANEKELKESKKFVLCSDHRPPTRMNVLAVGKRNGIYVAYRISDDKWHRPGNSDRTVDIKAWMVLPEWP